MCTHPLQSVDSLALGRGSLPRIVNTKASSDTFWFKISSLKCALIKQDNWRRQHRLWNRKTKVLIYIRIWFCITIVDPRCARVCHIISDRTAQNTRFPMQTQRQLCCLFTAWYTHMQYDQDLLMANNAFANSRGAWIGITYTIRMGRKSIRRDG